MPTHNEFENYGGIIDALNTVAIANGRQPYGYNRNYDGIISAILDLRSLGDAGTGEIPPGWEIITDDDGNVIGGDWQKPPANGDLWFDTRQGRLMVYIDDNYYQTNGADVLTVVSDTQPDGEVTGALWYNPVTGSLFIYDGSIWLQIAGTGTFATDTMYLSNDTRVLANAQNPTYLSQYTGATNNDYNQATLNRWIIQALSALDAEVSGRRVIEFGTEPASPDTGDLWFDSSADTLKTYNGNAWAPVIDQSGVNSRIDDLLASRSADAVSYSTRFQRIDDAIAALPLDQFASKVDIDTQLDDLRAYVNNFSATVGDVTRFKDKAEANTQLGDFNSRLEVIEGSAITDPTPLVTHTQLGDALAGLTTSIQNYNYATEAYVTSAIADIEIPAFETKVDQDAFDAYKLQADSTYIHKAGGEIRGPLKINNMDIAQASLDFSDSVFAGEKVLRLQTRGSDKKVTFGNTDKHFEIAWQFENDEDFAWKHGTQGKVFSISKDGAICAGLKIADFEPNDVDGLVINNVIDVKSTLMSHTAQLAALGSSPTGGNQMHYSDTPPTTSSDGDLWFDSNNIRLNVKHAGQWVFPDRVEDDALKSALFTAVQNSHDYESLKILLLAALI